MSCFKEDSEKESNPFVQDLTRLYVSSLTAVQGF